MLPEEMSSQFDIGYNNITSNQAPGLSEYEKAVILTKAQDETIKNHFSAQSPGNNLKEGFDDSAKRQADFSVLMMTSNKSALSNLTGISKLDRRSQVYNFPSDLFIPINETLISSAAKGSKEFQVIALRYDEYTRLMSKPFKRPLKHQAWRLINSGSYDSGAYSKCVEIITTPEYDNDTMTYVLRYLRRPKPIILADTDGLTINGYEVRTGYTGSDPHISANPIPCELDPILHEDILQRAVELAKIAWTQTGQENANLVLQAGQRSE